MVSFWGLVWHVDAIAEYGARAVAFCGRRQLGDISQCNNFAESGYLEKQRELFSQDSLVVCVAPFAGMV